MKSTLLMIAIAAAATLVIALSGCDSASTDPAASSSSETVDEHADHTHSDSDMDKMKAELAKMSPEDAASAEQQHICPVTGEMLGTMGPPKKVDVNGHDVWICCDGCKDELLANPDKYLAKLNEE